MLVGIIKGLKNKILTNINTNLLNILAVSNFNLKTNLQNPGFNTKIILKPNTLAHTQSQKDFAVGSLDLKTNW